MGDSASLLVSTAGGALAVWAYNKYGGPYGGITNPMEIKLVDIVGGGVIAALIGYFMYGRGAFDSYDVILSLVEGAAAVAIARMFSSSS